jgi:SAM-dependent methyltransferase
MNAPLEFDGERFTPESVREIWYEHMHRYAFAASLAGGLDVLDAACGEGYGTKILARSAKQVVGVDVSGEAVAHARDRYASDQVQFHEADCCDLPFEDERFDCVVSFETIEHLENQDEMLSEFRRVLKPSGFLLISSPDKAVYSDEQGFENPHHVKELSAEEFSSLLARHFPEQRMLGQKLLFHSAIWPVDSTETEGTRNPLAARLQTDLGKGPQEIGRPVQRPMYLLALCAATRDALPDLGTAIWLFDDADESVYQHYQHEIRKNMKAGGILAERDAELEKARAALKAGISEAPPRRSWLSRLGLSRRG